MKIKLDDQSKARQVNDNEISPIGKAQHLQLQQENL